MVMEVLSVEYDLPLFVPSSSGLFSFVVMLTTKDPGISGTSALTIAAFNKIKTSGTTLSYLNRQIVTGASNTGILRVDEPISYDLTDGAGHGILVATDFLYFSFSTVVGSGSATSQASFASCRIKYRWKEVKLEEYIGIVQSQAQN